jgi:hypothetical protein
MERLMFLLLLLPNGSGFGGGPMPVPSERLQVFAGLEAYSLSRWDIHFRAGAGVPADTCLPRFHREHAKAPQFNPIVGFKGILHAVENGVDSLLRFRFAHSRPLDDLIHKIEFDHRNLRISFETLFLTSGGALGNAN